MSLVDYDVDTQTLTCRDEWDLAHLTVLQAELQALSIPRDMPILINGQAITKMDSAAAWAFTQWQAGRTARLVDFAEPNLILLNLVEKELAVKPVLSQVKKLNPIAIVGRASVAACKYLADYLAFIGELTLEIGEWFKKPNCIRWSAIAAVIYRTGYEALPIIALISFMIGLVIAYQMGLELKAYGANVYVINVIGLSVLREFGPLITAIMVAGRSGSAFTAQLGMMKLNQEIDALQTMGLTPGQLLLLPRVIGLVIALPLITMWADIFGVLGGIVTAGSLLNISWYDFLHRFPGAVPLKTLLIGLGKTPIFALVIASIASHQGMRVELGANSVGRNTTRSVVLSIFFIIVVDAVFSVILSELNL